MCLKRKLISLYEKSESFSFLPFTVLAQQREKHGCGWIPPPPPGLNRFKFLDMLQFLASGYNFKSFFNAFGVSE